MNDERKQILSELEAEAGDCESKAHELLKRAKSLRLAVDTLSTHTHQPAFIRSRMSLQDMTIREALKLLLSGSVHPLRTVELHDIMTSNGKIVSFNALKSILYGKENNGDFVRVGAARWKLAKDVDDLEKAGQVL